MNKYVNISSSKTSFSGVSLIAISSIATSAIEDLGYVNMNSESKLTAKHKARLEKQIVTRVLKDEKINIYIHLSVKKGENASKVCSDVQEEVSDQVSSMLELSNFVINVKLENILL